MIENGGMGSNSALRGRGVLWRYKETLDLLEIWGQQNIQNELRSSHRNIDFFEYIANEMVARGYHRSAVECRYKTKVMRLEYKRVIDHNSRPGSTKVTCPFYKELHQILQGDARGTPKWVPQSQNLRQALQQATLPDTSVREEHFSSEDLNIINTGEYIKEKSTDSTEGMMPGRGTGEEMVETGDNNAVSTETEDSNGVNGGAVEAQRPQERPESQEMANNVEQPTATSQSSASPASRLSLARNAKKRERAESMFHLFLEQAREDSVKEQEEMVRDRVMLAKFLRAFEQDAADSREERKQCLEALRANSEVLRSIVGGLNKLTDALTSRR